MKTKKASKANTRSRIIFFAISLTYNLLLGLYLKDFLVLSPMLVTLYLLSALPTLFFVLKIRSTPMRAVVLIVLFFVMVISIVSSLSCRRLLPMLTLVVTAIEMMYFGIVDNSSGKDKLLTTIYVLVLTAFIAVLLFFSYNFVYKPDAPYLSNGRDTLWDTQTEELADEICAGCETDEEKVKEIYKWMIRNFEYDYEYNPVIQYFNVHKTLRTHKYRIDGIRTKMYKSIEEEAEVIRLIFSMYSKPQTSFGDVMRYLEEHGIRKRDGKLFNRSRLRDVVINPAYVKADYQFYEFFKAQGTNIVNNPGDFIGINGAYHYSDDNLKRKTISLVGHTLVLAPHEGLVDSATWIKCRFKCLNNQSVARPIKAKATWLAGKIKCACCGYALTAKIYKCKTKSDNRYYLCTNKYHAGGCHFGSLDADVVDDIVFKEMQKKLAEFQTLSKKKQDGCDLQVVKLKTRIGEIDKEISSLLKKIASQMIRLCST